MEVYAVLSDLARPNALTGRCAFESALSSFTFSFAQIVLRRTPAAGSNRQRKKRRVSYFSLGLCFSLT